MLPGLFSAEVIEEAALQYASERVPAHSQVSTAMVEPLITIGGAELHLGAAALNTPTPPTGISVLEV